MYRKRGSRGLDGRWDADLVRRLRRHLELTQREFAAELNARQQTVSEWETGQYRPRGPSARLLTLIAEEAAFPYDAGPRSGSVPPEAAQAAPDRTDAPQTDAP